MCLKGSWLNALSKTDLKSQSRSTYLVPRLHRLLIAESTDALLGNLFELEDLGAKDVKGISEPVGSWAAVRQSYDGCPSVASRRRLLSRAPWESFRVKLGRNVL